MPLPSAIPCVWLLLGCCACAAWLAAPDDRNDGETQDRQTAARLRMVEEQIAGRDVRNAKVLEAMRAVPRHLFVPPDVADDAYADTPLPIGHGQTISQPYIVALMTQLARPQPTDRALEIGTGCGYQAAVLSRLVNHVFTIELVEPLGVAARDRLVSLGYTNVTSRVGDGYQGWPSEAPFDIVLVTAAPESVPQPLVDQLKPGGRLVIPVGGAWNQNLELIEKDENGRTRSRVVAPVRFVPMIKK
ncbi:MAG: protein-L-isoaspartate(D-aspartate) O-methyltransferase [Bacteroidales bacterium]